MTTRQHAQAGLGVLGHDIRIPAADIFQRAAPYEAHRARENDGVAVRAAGHRDLEEVLVAVIEAPQVLVVRPVAIVLRGLDEGDFGIRKVSDHRAKPVRLDYVVGVDDADDLDVFGQPARGFIERAGLEPRPVLEMHESESRAELLALRLERTPDFAIRRVVVDDLDDQVRIVELRERLECFAHDLQGLVVRRDLDRNLGEVAGVDRVCRFRSAAQRVHDLEQVGKRKREGRNLQHEQQR